MGEKWVTILLTDRETPRCERCGAYMLEQKVHLDLGVGDEFTKVICDSCWKKDQKRGK